MKNRSSKVAAGAAGVIAVAMACAMAPAQAAPAPISPPPAATFAAFAFPDAATGSSTLLTGIRTNGSSNTSQVFMSGVYKTSAGTQGLLYEGALSGGGDWTLLNRPSTAGATTSSTALYGPDNIGTTGINVVGSYKTTQTGKLDHGVILSAPNGVGGAKTWTTLDATSLVTTGAHAWKAPAFNNTITLGSQGATVAAVQKALVARGFEIPGLGTSTAPLGTFGSGSKAALLAYQQANPGNGSANGQVNGSLYAALTTDSLKNTIAHSNRGGLVVGNFDTRLIEGRAFVTTTTGSKWFEITKPGAVSITAYGIWQNSTNNYTIAGGYFTPDTGQSPVEHGYLVTYNPSTQTLSNWASYDFQNRPAAVRVTHFDGITPDGNGGYNLTGDWLGVGAGSKGLGFFAHVPTRSNGTFGTATWVQLKNPGSAITSGNSVYENYAIGVYVNSGSSIVYPYLATILVP
ncbi:unannotated protein [freshwater metagenome]|uniref:Unannotated protein n=1 Tax=freshwater metagenome TaxID=449393 RepID=A0A6J7I4D4_9ZZZZ|nr:hypothetical protein [Actinomycetota bacterium]